MAAKDKYLTIAKNLRRELDSARAGFKSLNVADLQERAREIGGDGMHVTKDEGAKLMSECLREMGLTVYPTLDLVPQDGFVRLIRTGSILGTILANLQTPGPGSDADLGALINQLKRRDLTPFLPLEKSTED